MVRPTIKSLEQVIRNKDATINDCIVTLEEKNETIEFLEERLEINKKQFKDIIEAKNRTIKLIEERNDILAETTKVQQDHIQIKKEQRDRIRERLLSLSIGQRLFSWKEIVIKNLP